MSRLLMIVLLTVAQTAGAEEMGRLFFTPAERAQLERNKPQTSGSGGRTLTVNGIVQKRGGSRTVWINGVAQNAGASDDRSPDSLPVAVPGQKRPVKVKVGQKVPITPSAGSGE